MKIKSYIQFLYRIVYKGGVDLTWATSDSHARESFRRHNKSTIVKVERVNP